MAVSQCQCLPHRAVPSITFQLPSSQTEHRDCRTAAQRESRDCGRLTWLGSLGHHHHSIMWLAYRNCMLIQELQCYPPTAQYRSEPKYRVGGGKLECAYHVLLRLRNYLSGESGKRGQSARDTGR